VASTTDSLDFRYEMNFEIRRREICKHKGNVRPLTEINGLCCARSRACRQGISL
jgi:hypothetical protein